MMVRQGSSLGAIGLILASQAALSAPLASESFGGSPGGYPAGLEGADAGSGWGGPWKEFGSNANNGIFAGGIPVASDIAGQDSGNHARVASSTTGVGIGRNLAATVGADGTTAWISYRTQNGDTASAEAFAVVSTTLAEARRVVIGATRGTGGQSNSDGQFDLAYELTGANANVAPRTTASHFVVLRFDFGAGDSDTVTAFWDPVSTTDFNGPGSARLSGINATFDGFAFTATNATLQLDEIRIGTTLADVTGDGDDPPDPGDSDLDGDGLLDGWETAYGLDLNDDGSVNPDDGADGDPDGDGLPNREEQLLESSPINAADPDSRPWSPRPAKTHLLVIAAHPDDEGIFFGGLLPYATQVRRLNTVLVTMNSDRVTKDLKIREAELRNAVWKYGLRNQPVFARFADHADLPGGINSLNNAWNTWDGDESNGVADLNESGIPDGREAGARYLAGQIRRYRPEVVATHDIGGEYGHGAHQASGICTADAFVMAADPALAIAGLPPWQVKKLYIHRHGSNRLFHDHWETPSINDGGVMRSPREVTNSGLDFHVTQGSPNVSTVFAAGEVTSTWGAHPAEWWGLYASTVGPDSVIPDFVAPDASNAPMTYSGWARGDFFEHLTLFPDQDTDELPDDWEQAHFASLAAANPLADDDGDGRNNRDEFVAGLDPQAPDRSDLAISADGHTVVFSVPAAAGPGYEGLTRRYRLRYSPDLLDWSTVVAEGIADGTPLTHGTGAGAAGGRGFYRIEMWVD
jgi:LmbE family N-acetylglucosaminyl deacetylase